MVQFQLVEEENKMLKKQNEEIKEKIKRQSEEYEKRFKEVEQEILSKSMY